MIEAAFGTAEAFFNPAATGLIPQTVPEGELQQANAATSIVQNASELVGPAIATALVLGLGAGWAFAVDALTFVVSALLLARVRPRSRGERAARQRAAAPSCAIGWQELRSRQWAWVVIVATSLALLLALAPYLTLGPTSPRTSLRQHRRVRRADGGARRRARCSARSPGCAGGRATRSASRWLGRDLAAGVRAVRARAAAGGRSAPLFVLVGFGFSMFDVSWDTDAAGARSRRTRCRA